VPPATASASRTTTASSRTCCSSAFEKAAWSRLAPRRLAHQLAHADGHPLVRLGHRGPARQVRRAGHRRADGLREVARRLRENLPAHAVARRDAVGRRQLHLALERVELLEQQRRVHLAGRAGHRVVDLVERDLELLRVREGLDAGPLLVEQARRPALELVQGVHPALAGDQHEQDDEGEAHDEQEHHLGVEDGHGSSLPRRGAAAPP
jgi:hypothetical protein